MGDFDFIETKPTPARLAGIGLTLVLGFVFFCLMFNNSDKVYKRYEELRLAGRVDSVLSYSRGFPRVKLATGENQLIHSTAVGKYVQPGDSLTKSAKSKIITIYRVHGALLDVTVFGHDSINYSGIIKQYQVRRP